MARGTSLSALRDMLRAEIGASSNVAMGINTQDQYDHLLRRTQDRLWNEFNWPFGYIERDEQMENSSRYYAFDPEIDFTRIVSAEVKYDGTWMPLKYGISRDDYNAFDSDDGETNEPALRWQHYEGNQFEIWPMPETSNQIVRFRAIKKLPPLIAPSDTAVLDDTLIVLFCAAELLARSKATDAQAKLSQATAHYNSLKGNAQKNGRFIFGGGLSDGSRIRYVGGMGVREN